MWAAIHTVLAYNVLTLLAVSQETYEDGSDLEAELTALLETDNSKLFLSIYWRLNLTESLWSAGKSAAEVSSTKQVKSTSDEDELEARLASLTLRTGVGPDRVTDQEHVPADQLQPHGQEREKSKLSIKPKKVPTLPAWLHNTQTVCS